MAIDQKDAHKQSTQRWKANLSEERKEGYAEADSDRHRAERDSWSTETLQQHRTQHNDHKQELRTQRWALSAGAACKCNIDSFNPDRMNIIANDLGRMIHTCNYCHAFGFESEMRYTKHMHHMGRLCCNQGQISLSTPPPFPIQLYSYFTGQSSKHKHFRKRIRYFNSGMAMASLQLNDATVYKNGPAAFKIHGQLYKRLGPMHASNFYDSGHPKCLQIYFFDPDEQAAYRVNRPYPIPRSSAEYTMDKAIFAKLQTILTSCGNPLLNKYLTINEEIKQTNISPEEVRIVLDTTPTNNRHEGRFNAPTCSEISMLLPDENDIGLSKEAIVTPMRQSDPDDNPIRRIPDHNPAHDSFLYPLLKPTGDDGWHRELQSLNVPSEPHVHKLVSAREYTRYQIMKRELDNIDPNDSSQTVQSENMLHLSNKLFQQWLCDMWAKVESNDLGYIETHQTKLFADSYAKVQKRQAEGTTGGAKPIILPSSYTQSDRYMHKKLEDAMSVARVLGKPHLFITFTMNVFCTEVMQQLLPGQTPYDRPDIIARVYWQKYKAFIHEIEKDNIFGKTIARVSTVEFQKRGKYCICIFDVNEYSCSYISLLSFRLHQ